MIISHENELYVATRKREGGKHNGAYYYSVEICKNIIPKIKTKRNWVTINIPPVGKDHSIVFIHNNLHPSYYEWLRRYEDLILVCGVPSTCEKVAHIGKAIYLPLSVDVADVEQYKTAKTKEVCFAGRKQKRERAGFHSIDILEDLPREELLREMAKYKQVYAVGRTAIEGKILGCEILPYDERFPDPSIWKIMDNSEAVPLLQKALDEVERCQ